MKYALAIAAFAAVARAQSACLASAAAVPACALGYLADAANSIGNCDIIDFQCQCSNSGAVQSAVAATVAQQCGGSINDVLSAASNLCACASSNSGQTAMASPSACLASAAAIPACALGYLASAAGAIGGCSVNDFACQCSNSAAVQGSIAAPVASACGGDVNAVIQSAGALCSCVSGNAGGGGSSGATATGSGSSPSSGGTTAAPSGSAGGSSSKTGGVSVFTGAGATGAAFLPVGGVMGAMVGLLAVL